MALEQVASAHESFVNLLREIDPRELIRIAEAAGIAVGEVDSVRERPPKIEVSGLAKAARLYEADLVFTLHAKDGTLLCVLIFEIQLSRDRTKLRRWAMYPVAYALEFGCDGKLAVLSPEPGVRGWIDTQMIPQIDPRPTSIHPDHIQRITDYDDARRRPALTILGAVYHAHRGSLAERVAVVRAAFVAIQTLPDVRARRYSVLVMSIAPQYVVEQVLNELRDSSDLDESRYELFSDTERLGHSFAVGFEEGEAKGLEQGLRRAIIDILELRGFEVIPALRERIHSCRSLEDLERWYEAAKTAAANQPLDALFD